MPGAVSSTPGTHASAVSRRRRPAASSGPRRAGRSTCNSGKRAMACTVGMPAAIPLRSAAGFAQSTIDWRSSSIDQRHRPLPLRMPLSPLGAGNRDTRRRRNPQGDFGFRISDFGLMHCQDRLNGGRRSLPSPRSPRAERTRTASRGAGSVLHAGPPCESAPRVRSVPSATPVTGTRDRISPVAPRFAQGLCDPLPQGRTHRPPVSGRASRPSRMNHRKFSSRAATSKAATACSTESQPIRGATQDRAGKTLDGESAPHVEQHGITLLAAGPASRAARTSPRPATVPSRGLR